MRVLESWATFSQWLAPSLRSRQPHHDPSALGSKYSLLSGNLHKHGPPPVSPPLVHKSCNNAQNRGKWCTDKTGKEFDISTDYEDFIPETGVTNYYTLVLTDTTCNFDGYESSCILINGTYPGPLISGNWGDWFDITVINNLSNCNGTAIHWHGIRQQNRVFADGVPGVTQCPIPPGQSMHYVWRATQYGSSWYHSHFSLQYSQGALGPLALYGPTTANYDYEGGHIMLTDWYHQDTFSLFWKEVTPNVIKGSPPPDSFLLNGHGNYTVVNNVTGAVQPGCVSSDPLCKLQQASKFKKTVQPGKSYKFRIVNGGTETNFAFWIDGHDMQVVGTDFVAVHPYTAKSLNVAIGQRYDIIVTANADTSKSRQFWMRMRPCDQFCAGLPGSPANQSFECSQGILQYKVAGVDNPDLNIESDPAGQQCLDVSNNIDQETPSSLAIPYVPRQVKGIPAEINLYSALHDTNPYFNVSGDHQYQVGLDINIPANFQHWVLTNNSFRIDWRNPSLKGLATQSQSTFPVGYEPVYIEGASDEWQFFVIEGNWTQGQQDLHPIPVGHPIHLHGHDYVILHQAAEKAILPGDTFHMNIDNPQRRDVAMLPKQGFMVIGFRSDNPGPWLMHCHIAWHASGGLALQFIENKEKVPGIVPKDVLDDLDQRCQAWAAAYDATSQSCPTLKAPAEQEDSGI